MDTVALTHFQHAIADERQRLNTERAAILVKQSELAEQLAAIDRELHALDVYEQARTGKPNAPKALRGTHRETVLSLIAAHKGLAPKDIKDKLGHSTPKGLHNILAVLKKQGKVKEDDGKYVLAA